MNTLIQQHYTGTLTTSAKRTNIFTRFINWATNQEPNRMLWAAIGITAHGCVLTPLTMLAVMYSGNNNMIFWAFGLAAMAMTLVSNLAAMPTKYTVPIFLFSVFIDAAIIASIVVKVFA